jgi:hypothetical protein
MATDLSDVFDKGKLWQITRFLLLQASSSLVCGNGLPWNDDITEMEPASVGTLDGESLPPSTFHFLCIFCLPCWRLLLLRMSTLSELYSLKDPQTVGPAPKAFVSVCAEHLQRRLRCTPSGTFVIYLSEEVAPGPFVLQVRRSLEWAGYALASFGLAPLSTIFVLQSDCGGPDLFVTLHLHPYPF